MKYLIFDCGGVLVYPSRGEWNLPYGMAEILGDRAKDIGTDAYREAYRQSVHWLDETRLVPDVEAERELRLEHIRSMDARMGWGLTTEEPRRLADDFTDNILRYGMFEDVAPWLRRWKRRYSLGMLSDAMPSILGFLEQFGILNLFDAAVISTQVGAIKPDGRMYAAILKALDARPGDCLFVDDRASNLEGAVAVGMHAVQMARPEFPPDVLWDGPVARSFEALNGLIEA